MLGPLPATFDATRDALHALAEHVIAPARYYADQHIGLVCTPGGFGTPTFGDGERVRVEGLELVHERPGTTVRVAITTLQAAAQFVGVPLGAPRDVYTPATECVPDATLAIDADGVRALAEWFDFASGLLGELRERYRMHTPTPVVLWPEHFDLACEFGGTEGAGRANYGAAVGDASIAEPYLYVGPWDQARRTGVFARCPFGAADSYSELLDATDAKAAGREFYSDAAELLVGAA
jgi:hypothetical protein